MTVPFIGEIRIFPGISASPPAGWAFCEGQEIPIRNHEALFAIIGSLYGGDGRTKFNLPNLSGRVAIGAGHGPGLLDYPVAASGGAEHVTLSTAQIPSHTHAVTASKNAATVTQPGSGVTFAKLAAPATLYNDLSKLSGADADFATTAIQETGASETHDNLMPTMALKYMIALDGVFPPFP